MTPVEIEDWHGELSDLHGRGLTFLDFVTAVDHGEEIALVARLVDPHGGRSVLATKRLSPGDPTVASVGDLFPGALWHERETAEMFGVRFVDHPDLRPLLLRSSPPAPPLRRSTPLPERLDTVWPGQVDSGSRPRRRALPPGVRESWVDE